MGFLEASRLKLRLSKLRKQLEAEPSPSGLAELARGYLSLGDRQNALSVLNTGDRLFRGSDILLKTRAAVDGDVDDRISKAKEALRNGSTVGAFLELADAYRTAGRLEQMRTTLRDALEKFPSDSTILTRIGDLRYRRFLETLAGPDGSAAIDHLERAIASDSGNQRARYMLAELYYRLGAIDSCGAAVDELLKHSPEHTHAQDLQRALAKDRAERSADRDSEAVWSLIARVEEHGAFPNPRLPWESSDGAPALAGEPIAADPESELEKLCQATLASQAIYGGAKGELHARGAIEALPEAIRRLKETCTKAAGGMELGVPLHFSIETDQATLLVEMKRSAVIGLLAPPRAPLRVLTEAARDTLEKLARG